MKGANTKYNDRDVIVTFAAIVPCSLFFIFFPQLVGGYNYLAAALKIAFAYSTYPQK